MPAVRLGYVVAPAPVIDGLARLRQLVDVCGDPILEVAMAELVAEGELQRHVWRMRKVFEERRDALAQALRADLGSAVRFRPPSGGPTLWCEVDPAIDVERWVERAKARGVWFNSGSRFFLGEPRASLSLSFVSLAPKELREAVRRMALGLADLRSRR
jgi:GntR family transcriptional regulator/MocR family aminotransferase